MADYVVVACSYCMGLGMRRIGVVTGSKVRIRCDRCHGNGVDLQKTAWEWSVNGGLSYAQIATRLEISWREAKSLVRKQHETILTKNTS